MSDILELIKSRRSIRKYKEKPVEKEKIEKIMEAARWAPSAKNSQPWKFIIMKTKGREEMIRELAYGRGFVSEAPVLILACGDDKKSECTSDDVSLAIQNICLEAHSIGLGTCIIGYFDKEIAKSVFKIEKHLTVYYMITLGYPEGEIKPGNRMQLEDLYSYLEE